MTATEHADRRSVWGLWLRIGISFVILGILLSRIHLGSVLPEGRSAALSVLAIIVGVLAAIGSIALGAFRWKQVFTAFGLSVRYRTLLNHYFAGQFLGNVLPSTIGGDVLRISRATATTGSSEMAFSSVVLERLTGFMALPVLSLAGLVLRPSLLDVRSGRVALLIDVVVIVLLGLILYASGHPRLAGRFAAHDNWMRFIGAVHIGVDRLRRRPRHAAGVLGASLLYQASAMVVLYAAVRMLELPVPATAVLAVGPAVAMLQVLPISLSGLGIREAALVLFLHPFGVTTSQAVALGLIWYGLLLLASLLGAPSFAVGHGTKTPTS
ncbi:MAG: lysylphosphatidylglycerol synthase transmembrane domain-containing protein [Acidimicrobiia bacterium]